MPKEGRSHCQEIMKKPLGCKDKEARSYALCLAWKMKNDEKLEKLPLKKAWGQFHSSCKKQRS
jgi:hypothetical protein